MKKLYTTIVFILSFFVSQATNYYLSSTGSDTANGTSQAQPWRTISKLDSVTFAAGDSVFFKRGNKFRGTVTVHQSGTASAPIVFSAYGIGSKPIITGAVPLTNWTSSGNLYQDTVVQRARNFFVNNNEMPLARFPNSGFLSLDSSLGTGGLLDSALTQPAGYWDSCRICVRTTQWSWEKTGITNYTQGQLTFSTPTQLAAISHYGYFLYNKFSELDTAFEWFQDTTQHLLYYMPPTGQDPNLQVCEATVFGSGIHLFSNVSHIIIYNLTFDKQFEAGVKMEDSSCSYNAIVRCGFTGQYDYGVEVKGKYNLISNCTFRDVDGHGVDVSSGGNAEIHHNSFRKIGQYRNSGIGGQTNLSAIAINFADSCYIHHNSIDSTGYCGISADGANHLVERNVIAHAMMLLNDGAPLKSFGIASHHIIFRNNFISSSNGNTAGTFNATFRTPGIYFDFDVNNSIIQNNTIYNQRPKGIFLNGGNNNNIISGNVVYGTSLLIDMNGASLSNPIHDDVISRNVFFALDTGSVIIRQTDQAGTFTFGEIDSNYYFNPYNATKIALRFLGTTPTYYTLPAWQLQSGNDVATKESFVQWILPTNNSQLFMNISDTVATINLGATEFLDLDSNMVCGSISLDPFTSKILVNTQVSCAVTVKEITDPNDFAVYPNPFNSELIIKNPGVKTGQVLTVFDVFGKEITSMIATTETFKLQTTEWKDGVYFLRMGTKTKKIVKM